MYVERDAVIIYIYTNMTPYIISFRVLIYLGSMSLSSSQNQKIVTEVFYTCVANSDQPGNNVIYISTNSLVHSTFWICRDPLSLYIHLIRFNCMRKVRATFV